MVSIDVSRTLGNVLVTGPNMPYNVEPHVALKSLHSLINSVGDLLDVIYSVEVVNVSKSGAEITALQTSDGRMYAAKVFIDSSCR